MKEAPNSPESKIKESSSVPLSLDHLQEAVRQLNIGTQVTQANAREVCAYVTVLSLHFKGIGSLDLAWLLVNVTHLYLSNNELEATNGLQNLKQLQYLDISLNKIRNTDHLADLESLEVLSLHGNQIFRLQEKNFLNMKKLEVLSLGKNLIEDKADFLIFAHLDKLGSLSAKGNPCCHDDYPDYVIAHVPNLSYLDYLRITEEERKAASEKFRESLLKVEGENERRREKHQETLKKREEERRHRMAGVFGLNDDTLFDKLFEGDSEMRVLTLQPGVQALIDRFREQIRKICMRLFDQGLLHAAQRSKELIFLEDGLMRARQSANEVARRAVLLLDEDISQLLEEIEKMIPAKEETQAKMDSMVEERKLISICRRMEDIFDLSFTQLLEEEVILANQIKEVLEKAEEELGSMVAQFLTEAAEQFEEGRRYAYSFYCRLREITSKLADAAVSVSKAMAKTTEEATTQRLEPGGKDVEGGAVDHVAEIFEGADTLTAALARVHDKHLDVINKREEELKTHLNSWFQDKLEEFYRLEWRRHRTRLEEISTLSSEKEQQILRIVPLEVFQEAC